MNFSRFAVVLCTALLALLAAPAFAWNRLEATQFATLPAGTAHPAAAQVTRHTIARLPAHIPPIRGR